MYNNQDILKKHTALAMSRKDVDTSLILFPVRIETRFVDNYSVEDVNEPDKALYAFMSLWAYVDNLPKYNEQQILRTAQLLLVNIEDLDSVYREDRSRLLNIARAIVKATSPSGELRKIWDRILTHIPRLSTLDVVNDNEATVFLRQLETVNHSIRRLFISSKDGKVSAARMKAAKDKLKECFPVLEKLLPEKPEDTIVNRFSLITRKQYLKFLDATSFLKLYPAKLSAMYDLVPEEAFGKVAQRFKDQLRQALFDALMKYEEYRKRYYGEKDPFGGRYYQYKKPRRQSLRDKMRSKIGEYNRYTRFAELMIMWRLRMVTGLKRDEATTVRVEKWRKLADNTIFTFHVEREWLISVLNVYNKYKQTNDLPNKISASRLNRHTKVIRRRRLLYHKPMKCLLVRIYPDQIAITQLYAPLTAKEAEHAQEFWIKFFMAQNDEKAKKAAWESLCTLYTPPRAALLARKVLPAENNVKIISENAVNLARKGLTYATLKESDKKDLLVRYFTTFDTDSKDVFTVPMSELMPDRFVLQANLDDGKKGKYIVQYGHLIPKTIQVGMDLNNEPYMSLDGRFMDNLRWLTNYNAAEKMGLAITLPLDPYKKGISTFHFNSIYVMGMKEMDVDNKKDSDLCSALLREIFSSHLYSQEGLDLLKIGTPTNILSNDDMQLTDADSQYDTGNDALVDLFYDKSIKPLPEGIKAAENYGDACILSKLFGIDAGCAPANNPFYCVSGRDNIEVYKEKVVKEEFLNALSGIHPIMGRIAGSNRLKNYFLKNVSPLGVYPSLRVGSQPYGIVPVCDFKNLKFGMADPLQTLKRILLLLTDRWNELSETSVISENNMNKDKRRSTEESYLKAISSTPISTSFYERVQVKDSDILTPEYFKGQRYNLKPFEQVFFKLKSVYPALTKQQLMNEYLPSFGNIPVTDENLSSKIDNFTWGTLKDRIKANVKTKNGFDKVSDEELERLITATFDLFNYRLDAWLTGLLNHRMMQRMNVKGTHKISIGAYGWVFNLWEDKAEPVSEEYIFAPSVNHAVTAAVLRSSFNRAAEGERKDYSLSVNLSSSRVRQALRIIKGVRNGLSLGTILGSDLERLLHDDKKKGGLEMDYFIYFLRKAYPLNNTTYQYSSSSKVKRDSSLDVLNGVALLEDLRDESRMKNNRSSQLVKIYTLSTPEGKNMLWPWLEKVFQETDQNKIQAQIPNFEQKIARLIYLIQEMEDSYDALSDVVTAESVYKLTEGNQAAVDALMNSMNTGRNFPEPDVTEIPVSSAHIERRVIVALESDPKYVSDESYFQSAEPALDKWMDDMLGFGKITAQIKRDGAVVNVLLGEGGLGLTASELVYLSQDWDKFKNFLEWLYWYKEPAPTDKFRVTLDEAELAVDSLRELLSRAYPLKQEDLIAGTMPANDCIDNNAEKKRFEGLRNEVERVAVDLPTDPVSGEAEEMQDNNYCPDPSILRRAVGELIKCFRIGETDALTGLDSSVLFKEADRYTEREEYEQLQSQWLLLTQKCDELSTRLLDKVNKFNETGSCTDAVKKLLVSSFISAPLFNITDNPAIDVNSLLEQCSGKYTFDNVDRRVIEEDLISLADVRPQMAALHQLRLYGKVNSIEAAREVAALQFETDTPKDRSWMGAKVKAQDSVRDANVYEILKPTNFLINQKEIRSKVSGLVLDYWVEKIPYPKQTAALAFSYDQPDAEPPQAILVGVSTLSGKHRWSGQRMLRAIHSAMYQVKSRAVEPEHLYEDKWASGFLPLLNINPNDTLKTNK